MLGVANRRSIAWAIAKRLADEGAQLAFTYQGERIEKSVRDLAETVSSPLVTECDVRADADVERVFREALRDPPRDRPPVGDAEHERRLSLEPCHGRRV